MFRTLCICATIVVSACQASEMNATTIQASTTMNSIRQDEGAVMLKFDPAGVRADTTSVYFLFGEKVDKKKPLSYEYKPAFNIVFGSVAHMSFISSAKPTYAIKNIKPGTYYFLEASSNGPSKHSLSNKGVEFEVEPGTLVYLGDFQQVSGRLKVTTDLNGAISWLKENHPSLLGQLKAEILEQATNSISSTDRGA